MEQMHAMNVHESDGLKVNMNKLMQTLICSNRWTMSPRYSVGLVILLIRFVTMIGKIHVPPMKSEIAK